MDISVRRPSSSGIRTDRQFLPAYEHHLDRNVGLVPVATHYRGMLAASWRNELRQNDSARERDSSSTVTVTATTQPSTSAGNRSPEGPLELLGDLIADLRPPDLALHLAATSPGTALAHVALWNPRDEGHEGLAGLIAREKLDHLALPITQSANINITDDEAALAPPHNLRPIDHSHEDKLTRAR